MHKEYIVIQGVSKLAKNKTTKQKICEQAQKLFMEKGYHQVSLREIAEAAGTTIGNFTYHFPQKVNLIEAIQMNLHEEFQSEFFPLSDEQNPLGCLFKSFEKAQENREKNMFYFKYIHELTRDSSTLAKNNEEFRQNLYGYYRTLFSNLKKSGYFRDDIPDRQYESLAYTIVFLNTLWFEEGSPYYDKNLPSPELASTMKHIIYPYLTDKGLSQVSPHKDL